MDVSGPMKSLLDHLCFMWMSHRPNPLMFRKIGLIIHHYCGRGGLPREENPEKQHAFLGHESDFFV